MHVYTFINIYICICTCIYVYAYLYLQILCNYVIKTFGSRSLPLCARWSIECIGGCWEWWWQTWRGQGKSLCLFYNWSKNPLESLDFCHCKMFQHAGNSNATIRNLLLCMFLGGSMLPNTSGYKCFLQPWHPDSATENWGSGHKHMLQQAN